MNKIQAISAIMRLPVRTENIVDCYGVSVQRVKVDIDLKSAKELVEQIMLIGYENNLMLQQQLDCITKEKNRVTDKAMEMRNQIRRILVETNLY